MVLYLLQLKFPDHPDFRHKLTESSSSSEEIVKSSSSSEEEPSSEEEIIYEYDVLLYLKEDKERRQKTVHIEDINIIRKGL